MGDLRLGIGPLGLLGFKLFYHSPLLMRTISLNLLHSLPQSYKSPTTPRKLRMCIHWSETSWTTQQPAVQFNQKLAWFCPSFRTSYWSDDWLPRPPPLSLRCYLLNKSSFEAFGGHFVGQTPSSFRQCSLGIKPAKGRNKGYSVDLL